MIRNLPNLILLFIIAAIVMVAVAGCAPSREDQIKTRLEEFKSILPDQVKTAFENGQYDQVVQMVDSVLALDPAFKNDWEDIKSAEAISLFSTKEVIEYYEKYFVNYRE